MGGRRASPYQSIAPSRKEVAAPERTGAVECRVAREVSQRPNLVLLLADPCRTDLDNEVSHRPVFEFSQIEGNLLEDGPPYSRLDLNPCSLEVRFEFFDCLQRGSPSDETDRPPE